MVTFTKKIKPMMSLIPMVITDKDMIRMRPITTMALLNYDRCKVHEERSGK